MEKTDNKDSNDIDNEECSICMENSNECFIYPCMHELCKGCSEKIRSIGNNKCHYCRGEIEDIISCKDGSVIPKPPRVNAGSGVPIIPINPMYLNLGTMEDMETGVYFSYNIVLLAGVRFYTDVHFYIDNNDS